MRVVLDTDVVISALFFAGLPGRIIDAWIAERFGEYRRVAARLTRKFPSVRETRLCSAPQDSRGSRY